MPTTYKGNMFSTVAYGREKTHMYERIGRVTQLSSWPQSNLSLDYDMRDVILEVLHECLHEVLIPVAL
jgi:hypothetical protein